MTVQEEAGSSGLPRPGNDNSSRLGGLVGGETQLRQVSLEGLASGTGANFMLFRVEIKSRHGASSTTKASKLTAHIYSIVVYNLGVGPGY